MLARHTPTFEHSTWRKRYKLQVASHLPGGSPYTGSAANPELPIRVVAPAGYGPLLQDGAGVVTASSQGGGSPA
jgi:hypothetical protein